MTFLALVALVIAFAINPGFFLVLLLVKVGLTLFCLYLERCSP